MVQNKFEMSTMRELRYFPSLKNHQSKEGTFINKGKFYKELLKRFNMDKAKSNINFDKHFM